ncbi:unnamed protein product [Cuscuta epithymum]|uniref:PPM-type phosphatase domain-containing protein n=1 Tax=Cuscuta epithymum TaxID=186058 RepID=A0AAV0ENN1_9ASTE|nr:unnamed protein product [Cuscuta epithymum]
MGTCVSCQRGVIERYDVAGNLVEENAEHLQRNNGEEDDIYEGVAGRGDYGARIRLHGSSSFISMYSRQGRKGINQDSMTVWENFTGQKGTYFCGVFDGHGPSGHKVSRYVRDILPSKLSQSSSRVISTVSFEVADDDTSSEDLDEKDDGDDPPNPFLVRWKSVFLDSFKEMDEDLEGQTTIDIKCSGSTAVTVLKQDEHLVIGNLGDSRAVICTRDDSDQLVAEQLTVDLKPNLPGEFERIKNCNGRVIAMAEEPNVYRIWKPDEDSPGLAMARAFGDFCLKSYGLSSVPQMHYRKLTDKDEFVVLATDGVWDVLSNNEVIRTVASARRRSMAARFLVERAVRVWKHKYPCARTDDCAAVCLFFKRHRRPSLTRSLSQEATELLAYNYPCSANTDDDGLDTLLNYKVMTVEGDDSGQLPDSNGGNNCRPEMPTC